jgi:uncharacterized NAD-dependent epimerase/dehydratase family protein
MRRLVILTEGHFGPHDAKTAMGVIRYGTDPITAVLDSGIAGRNISEFVPGRDIPAVATLDEALALPEPPNTLLIGIAPTGGRLPDEWRAIILAAIGAGMDVHSGLHTFLGDDPEFSAAAAAKGVQIVDFRRPPERKDTAVGRPHAPGKRVILTVGTDCAIGKMSVALELRKSGIEAGDNVAFVPTGQTGMMIDGWGVAVDDHPAYSSVTLGLIHGSTPHAMVMVHKPGLAAHDFDHRPDVSFPIAKLPGFIALHEQVAGLVAPSKVVAMALNTSLLPSEDDARRVIEEIADETGLPTDDPVRFGAGRLWPAIREAVDALPWVRGALPVVA